MKPLSRLNSFLTRIPLHLVIIFMCMIWLIPTLGVFITSFRPAEATRTTGWWTAFTSNAGPGAADYDQFCASCHGTDGKKVATADLTNPKVVNNYPRSISLLVLLKKPLSNGSPHITDPGFPADSGKAQTLLTPILAYMRTLSGTGGSTQRFTLRNYADAIVGYKGTQDYITDCQNNLPSVRAKFSCNFSDVFAPEGMGRAFLNTIIVVIPASILPIIFASFAAYAFAWMDFKGRQVIFALLVALQIVPLQMVLVPIARLYSVLGLQGQFLGVWLFHTGFGLPYAIYLIRNFIGGLPREIFESAYIDGANHWSVFRKLAIPLAMPSIASLAIYQFLWVWNDFLVAKVFLNNHPVLTVQITNLVDPHSNNWNILTGAAFLSFIIPMIVFFSFQRYFARGLLTGSVKG